MIHAIVSIRCPDRPGIIALVSQTIFRLGGNIVQSDQHATGKQEAGGAVFYMRIVVELYHGEFTAFCQGIEQLSGELSGRVEVRKSEDIPKMGILVSRNDHCLADILYRQRIGELRADIPFIISNHRDCEKLAESHGIPFHYVEMKNRPKAEAEAEILKIAAGADFLVLARFMQILSKDFLSRFGKDIINIHHSFLPSFKGAHPYRQAFERGVKLIGATAHFVTEELDEGPIIEQMVERVTHRDTENDLKRKGRNLEVLALASALRAYLEHRVIRHGNKTIVFG